MQADWSKALLEAIYGQYKTIYEHLVLETMDNLALLRDSQLHKIR